MRLRLAFMGTADFAVPSLAALIAAGHDVAAVYSQPARPRGRGHKPLPSPVAALALEKSIELRTPEKLDADAIASFRALDLDVAVVAAYGLILPQAVLDAPKRGCVNVHASLLPRWRGAAPIERAILAGDSETGVTIMSMAAGLDTGPILLAEPVPISLRALNPRVPTWFTLGDARIKLIEAEPVLGGGAPGTVLDGAPTVACGEGALRLVRLQREGRAAMSAAEFLRGHALPPGTLLPCPATN